MVPHIPALAWFQPSLSQVLAKILLTTMIKCENRATKPFSGYTPIDTYAVTPPSYLSLSLSISIPSLPNYSSLCFEHLP